GVLFKRFADIDVFDIELKTHDVDEFIAAVRLMEPTFGGINLEDIKAPECFEIERRLIEAMDIPVFHDDQHGTAIISAAALLNAVELAGKKMEDIKLVISGAGAAAISCARHYQNFGLKPEHIIMCDSRGPLYKGRTDGINKYKEEFMVETEARTLAEAMVDADVFIGLSMGGLVSKEMVKSMADNPIVFALANPDPEISYEDAMEARSDVIMATGRSDKPNQVNNVLGFPFIFRGALDVHARAINTEMKIAATRALAELAHQDVPDSVTQAYETSSLMFGRNYIIPKPLDQRVLPRVASAVAKAAMDTGVARKTIDINKYKEELEARLGRSRALMMRIIHKARLAPKKIVFPEGECDKIIRASQQIYSDGIARPVLLGDESFIRDEADRMNVNLDGVEILDPARLTPNKNYIQTIYQDRQRKGMTRRHAINLMRRANYYGSMMVKMGDADGLVSGIAQHYADTVRPALQILQTEPGIHRVAGSFILAFKNKVKFLADVTINIEPDAETLAETALLTAREARKFGLTPRVALLSFSNFGSVKHHLSRKVKEAVRLIKEQEPELQVDGELHADVAVDTDLLREHFPFSMLQEEANVLIFPDLTSGNIAYKLLSKLANATAIGPILMGIRQPVNLLQYASSSVEDIVNMTAITVLEAQEMAVHRQSKEGE
ncbi:MAG: NADP-dependent malic enzyme, partial [Fidelibacterota bacterium]